MSEADLALLWYAGQWDELALARRTLRRSQIPSPSQLRWFGYAPGDYLYRCVDCRNATQGDKRSLTCRACATERFQQT